ncbi:unnamed protein product [Caenorhabditis auriculariae]|uniref:G protein-coupled receptor n=1 Tax=Caenorhabditis auriculariae TaxID=2777116 RepID=A0A8S1HHA5_9PELO|nr:unnamed protein product [Caenorhabditis auriculariae]
MAVELSTCQEPRTHTLRVPPLTPPPSPFKALVVQAAIPLVVSFSPCFIVWYTPLFEIQAPEYTNTFGYPMLSAFPCCDPLAIMFLIADYRHASPIEWRRKISYLVLISDSIVGFSVIAVCIYLATKIISTLKTSSMSFFTQKIHAQLLRALIVQTAIPIFFSFLPCIVVCYAPVFDIRASEYADTFGYPMLSAFPCCDPLAIIFLIPDYRHALSQSAEATLECTRGPCPSPIIPAVPVPAKLRDLLVEERGDGP